MDLVIYEHGLNAIIQSIERDRPEYFGFHTENYEDTIEEPWSKNEPGESTKYEEGDIEIDHDIRGTDSTITLKQDSLLINISLKSKFKRRTSELTDEVVFTVDLVLEAELLKPGIFDKYHKLYVNDIILKNIKQKGLRDTLSWHLSGSMNETSSDKFGIAVNHELFDGALKLKLKDSNIRKGLLSFRGSIRK